MSGSKALTLFAAEEAGMEVLTPATCDSSL